MSDDNLQMGFDFAPEPKPDNDYGGHGRSKVAYVALMNSDKWKREPWYRIFSRLHEHHGMNWKHAVSVAWLSQSNGVRKPNTREDFCKLVLQQSSRSFRDRLEKEPKLELMGGKLNVDPSDENIDAVYLEFVQF